MTALVTGAAGFVGAAVVRALLARGRAVRAFVRPTSDRRMLAGLDIDLVVGDLTDEAAVRACARDCEEVYHVAADYRLWVPDPPRMYAANVDGTRHVLRGAAEAGARRIVHTSSVATLGLHEDGTPADETTPSSLADMIGHYKRSKFMAEEAARELIAAGAPVVIVNPSTPVGPGDHKPTPTGRLVLDAAAGRMPAFVDTGLNIAHVDDVAAGHLLAAERGTVGERYILGGENLTLRQILVEIASITGRPPPRIALPHGLVLPVAYAAEAWARLSGGREPIVTVDGVKLSRKRMFFSPEKARRELGYSWRPARAALEDAITWFRGDGRLV